MGKSKHDQIAEKLAKKFNTEYRKDKRIDVVTKDRVIEVETKKNSLSQGIKQVQNSPKARYIAVNKINIKNALDATQDAGIGVMSQTGRIVKRQKILNGSMRIDLKSKLWNTTPQAIKTLQYEYKEKEIFLKESNKLISLIESAYEQYKLYFTKQNKSLEKTIWMLHMDAISTIKDCLELLKNKKYRLVFKLIRDIFETIDLSVLFWLTKNQRRKYLDRWYNNKTVSHSDFRNYLDKKLKKIVNAKFSSSIYKELSSYTHHNYSALMNSYCLGAGDRIWFDTEGKLALPIRITEAMWLLACEIVRLVYYCNCIFKDKSIDTVEKKIRGLTIFRFCQCF